MVVLETVLVTVGGVTVVDRVFVVVMCLVVVVGDIETLVVVKVIADGVEVTVAVVVVDNVETLVAVEVTVGGVKVSVIVAVVNEMEILVVVIVSNRVDV